MVRVEDLRQEHLWPDQGATRRPTWLNKSEEGRGVTAKVREMGARSQSTSGILVRNVAFILEGESL